MTWAERFNRKVAQSAFGRWFKLEFSGALKERKNSQFLTEVRAGLATFFAMAYIIAVNANITAQSGGTCVCPRTAEDFACDKDVEYDLCVEVIRRDLITATAAIAALSSFLMGIGANIPIAVAPGMGLNAYFAFQVVGYHGTGPISYQTAVTAVFVEGFIFLGLSFFGLRQWLARIIPASIKLATGAGIGLYLALIGLTYSAGIGAITGSTATPLELAGCLPQYKDEFGVCTSHKLQNSTLWVGIFCGGILTALLMMYRVKGAIIAGIALVSIISWPRGTEVTYFPDTPIGNDNFKFFKQVVAFHPIQKVLVAQDWDLSGAGHQFALAVITFLYVDILDCTGTLYSMARFGGFIDEHTQDFEGSAIAYTVDAMGITIGSLFGSPPVTAYIESGAGISEGGVTGITAMVTGFCFFISIFFAPIFASIPPWATGCTLVLVGSMMMKATADINWSYSGDGIPAFITIICMPFTYSIAYGLIAGIISYIVLNTAAWVIEKASGGRITPYAKEIKDPWTWRIPGGFFPRWLVRLFQGKAKFWESSSIYGKSDYEMTAPASKKPNSSQPPPSETTFEPIAKQE
ncbi:nucleoside transporter [Terfezia claveryi]|nr:nucleoside transporter [Terfezia claveryi]